MERTIGLTSKLIPMKIRFSLSALILFVNLSLMQSCSDKDEPFTCDQNTVSTVNGDKTCGTSQVMAYSRSGLEDDFRMQVAGGYNVRLQSLGESLEEGETYAVEVTFTGLNQHFENTLTIIKLDRDNKIFTFTFSFDNEGEANFKAYPLKATGKVTEINWF